MFHIKHIAYVVLLCIGIYSCATSRLCKKYDAVNKKKIKLNDYTINEKGDTVKIKLKLSLADALLFQYRGIPDSIITQYEYKGKPFTGKTLSLNKKDKYSSSDLMPGVYKTFTHFINGQRTLTEIYFPNDTLYKRVKGEFRGEYNSKLYEVYDENGILLKRYINQPGGFHYGEMIDQDQGDRAVASLFGDIKKKLELFDSTLAYQKTQYIKTEKEFYKSMNTDIEYTVEQYWYNEHGSLIKSTNNYEYRFGCCDHYDLCNENYTNQLHVEKFSNGLVKIAGQYKDSLPHGSWYYYAQEDELDKIEFYTLGNNHLIRYDSNGYIYFSVLFDNESGQIVKYKNDSLPIYFFYEFDYYGDRTRKKVYKDDSTAYSKNNTPYTIRFYEYSRKCKQDTIYLFEVIENENFAEIYENNIENEGKEILSISKNEFLENLKTEYWSNGRVKSYGTLSPKNKQDGIWIEFSQLGDTIIVSSYQNGFLNGMYEEYNGTKQKLVNGYYNKNKKTGIWIYYNKDGTINHKEKH